jgi:transposase
MIPIKTPDPKLEALVKQRTLNPKPDSVKAPLFQDSDFFDPRDLMQVKYEMLRHAKQVGSSVKETAASFGFSRVAFYQIRREFEQNGLTGLLPRCRGPKTAHKLTDEIMDFIKQALIQDFSLKTLTLVEIVKERFGITVHRRSIERALARQQKKLPA